MITSGTQTAITENIEKVTNQFTAEKFAAVFEILEWLHKNLTLLSDAEFKRDYFRKRTADEIIQSGMATGCTDYALVFCALARAKDVATTYVEALDADWTKQPDYNNIRGHVFCEVTIGAKTYVVDPQGAAVRPWIGKRYVVIGKGLDSWDLGVIDIETLKSLIQKTL